MDDGLGAGFATVTLIAMKGTNAPVLACMRREDAELIAERMNAAAYAGVATVDVPLVYADGTPITGIAMAAPLKVEP